MVISLQRATGGVWSSTVTVALQKLLLPFTSVRVSTTRFSPTSSQPNVVLLSSISSIPHASVDPALISFTVRLPTPVPDSTTVASWQSAVGATLSSTVTSLLQLLLLPLTSVMVRVTVFVPRSAQPKVSASSDQFSMPQASEEPLSI